ncbi:MAG: efflux RND transporter periplasmic adaptor subunit [Pirellulaceae bacterium]|nr:efflux RND transporter periplasmic adaptor subunit [Pirellulaceae bacterium]
MDDPSASDALRQIEAALDELAGLARGETTPADFHGRLLERTVNLLSAAGGVVWSLAGGRPTVECQLHLDHCLAGSSPELARHSQIAAQVAQAGEAKLVPPAFRDGAIGNASPWLLILAPVTLAGKPLVVVEIFQRPDSRGGVQQGYLRLLRTACDLAEEFHRGRALTTLDERQRELAGLLQLVTAAQQARDPRGVATAIASESRRLLPCDRVTVLARRARGAVVLAISGTETFDRRAGVIRALEKLVAVVIAADEPLWLADKSQLPPQLAEAVETFVDDSHARGLAILPLAVGQDDQREVIGALVCEQFDRELTADLRPRCEHLASASSLPLANALELEAIPLRGLLAPVGRSLKSLRESRRWQWAGGFVLIAAVVLALWLIPAELTVSARGELWPRERRQVFASADGIVVEVGRPDGSEVNAGDVLARLHSPALDLELSEVLGRQRTATESLQAAETEQLRGEQAGGSSLERSQLAARIETLKVELRGLEEQLAIVRRQQADLTLKSPLAGVVITWDAQRQLASRPVQRGDALLTVANLAGPWELLLDVPDRHASYVIAARRETPGPLVVSYQIGTDPATIRRGQVERIAPATQLSNDQQPVLRVVALPDGGSVPRLRPGATVVAKIQCGRRSLGYVWLHDVWDALRTWLVL